jgi:hypothetical protein
MSQNYKGVGTLKHVVKEANRDSERQKEELREAGEYFKNHTFQKRDSDKHDIDFKTTSATTGSAKVIDDRMLDKGTEKVVDQLKKNEVEGEKDEYDTNDTFGLKAYLKDIKAKEPKAEGEDSSKHIKMGPYSEAWYRELKELKKKV